MHRQRLGFPPGARRSFAGARRRSKPARADERDEENARLKAKVGELTMEGEVLRGEDRPPGGRPPFSRQEVEAMSQARFTSTGRAYGLKRVCALWGLARSTVYAQRRREAVPVHERPTPNKRGPVGPCTDAELLGHIRQVLEDSPFHGEGYRKVWARLRFAGIRTSKERVRCLMREAGLQAPHRVGKPRGPKAHNGTIRTERPDRMWGTHMTTTVTTEEGMASVFVAVDHCSVDCVGIHAAKSGNRFEALEPIRQGVAERFAGLEADVAEGLKVRHDHGPAYLSDDFQREIAYLGMTSSPSFVRAPEGNGYCEWFIRILKENLLWVRSFATVEELRWALLEFKNLYNHHWILEGCGYRTPAQARQEKLAQVAEAA